jgi:uncharacterized membrane protein
MTFLNTYKYTIGFVFSVAIAIVLFATGTFDRLIGILDGGGYVSAVVAGFLYPFTLTAASAALYLIEIGDALNPFALAILAGIGAMFADLIMFKLLKKSITDELKVIMLTLLPPHRRQRLERITKHRFFLWLTPLLASFLIASPFPDEIGVALFGIINFRPKYLSILSFFLNTIGIFFLVLLGYSLG